MYGAPICVLVFVFSTFIHLPDLFPLSINEWTGSMWWISLLTLYQLQVNNYYSCSIVAESIPGCRHLAWDKRLDCELLFCIWSDVIHFIISCNNRHFQVLRGVKKFRWVSWTSCEKLNDSLEFVKSDQFPNQRQACFHISSATVSVWRPWVSLYIVTHTRLRPHPAPCRTSFIVYSEYSVAPTLSPCGLDQSAVIMLIWAVSHWEKKEGVKSLSVCVCACAHACVCDYM